MDKEAAKPEYSTKEEEKNLTKELESKIDEFYRQGCFEDCIGLINDILKNPMLDRNRRTHLLFKRSNCYRKMDNFEQAEDDLLKVFEMTATTGSRDFHMRVLTTMTSNYADLAKLHKDNPEKKKKYQDLCLEKGSLCVNDSKQQYFLYNHMGDIYLDRKQIDEAIKAYTIAKKDNPDDYWGYMGIGHVYLEQKQYAESIRYYDKATELMEKKLETTTDRTRPLHEKKFDEIKEGRKKAIDALSG
ncbi:unnamed protein product [Sphagnum jensenii]|uniref:Tetratricopeptide repeat protein n=1 Tax=Sphagnum jensenii TaxID=128206 RepID=A0ABP0VH81_9BRYO